MIQRLREHGLDILAVIEDMRGAPDVEVLKRAIDENRILLTFDRDFGNLIFFLDLKPPPAVIYFRFTPSSSEELVQLLIHILNDPEITITSYFTVIERGRIRQRPLPE